MLDGWPPHSIWRTGQVGEPVNGYRVHGCYYTKDRKREPPADTLVDRVLEYLGRNAYPISGGRPTPMQLAESVVKSWHAVYHFKTLTVDITYFSHTEVVEVVSIGPSNSRRALHRILQELLTKA